MAAEQGSKNPMDVEVSVPPADAGTAPTTHDDLAKGFAAEISAERAQQDVEQAETAGTPEIPATEDAPQEAAPVAQESEAQEADDTAPAETDNAAETPSDVPSIAAPSGMTDADKAVYAKLPTELKAWVAKQESARTADYTRKTQVVSEQKRQFEAGVAGVMQRLQALDGQLAKFTDNDVPPPDPALRNTDPLAYDDQLAYYMQAQHNKEIAAKERQRLQAEYEQTSKAMKAQFLNERAQQLRDIAPELFSEKGEEIGKQIRSYAAKNGYTDEQLSSASATDILTLWKAQRFDAIEAAKRNVKPVPQVAPKVSKPGPAKVIGRPSNLANAIQNLNKNPSRGALAAAFAAEIASERR